MDTDRFVITIKIEDVYEDIANDVEKCFDASNYNEDDKRLLPIRKDKKVIGLFKNELGEKIMIKFVGIRAKIYSHLTDNNNEQKKPKGTKKCLIKRRLMFENYANCSFNDRTILQSQQRFKSVHHKVYT